MTSPVESKPTRPKKGRGITWGLEETQQLCRAWLEPSANLNVREYDDANEKFWSRIKIAFDEKNLRIKEEHPNRTARALRSRWRTIRKTVAAYEKCCKETKSSVLSKSYSGESAVCIHVYVCVYYSCISIKPWKRWKAQAICSKEWKKTGRHDLS